MIPDNNIIFKYEKYKNDLIKLAKDRKKINLNLDKPLTINDKINWIKIHPTKLKSFCTDKIKSHEYVKEIIGEDICIPIIKTYKSTDEINFDELPEKFVLKCNHGCAYNIIIKDKKSLDKIKTKSKLDKWLSTNFSYIGGYEMQYDDIQRRIYAEQYMGDITDYKFWCFNGEPKFWAYSLGNNGGLTEHLNFYDLNNNLLDLNNAIHPRDPSIVPEFPNEKQFQEMVEISKKLSSDFDFVRVDLYLIDNKIYVGELTFTPSAGWMNFGKDSKMLGELLTLKMK